MVGKGSFGWTLTVCSLACTHALLEALYLVLVLAQHLHLVNGLLHLSVLLTTLLFLLPVKLLSVLDCVRDALVLLDHKADFPFVR